MLNDQETGKITRIEQQKKNSHRYNVYIDDQYAFSVHEDVLVSCRLLKGKELTIAYLNQILVEEEKKKIERAGLRYLSYRARTKKEMETHLSSKEFDLDLISDVISKWIDQGLIDDLRFAIQWCTERSEYKKRGKRVLREELKEKGVAPLWIEQALEHINDEVEWNACLQLAEKKVRMLKDFSEPRNRSKLFQYLMRKGYSLELIQQIYRHLLQKTDQQ
ncbi:RecX family transcriptional regulator [Caldalkalibacillus mannanilyticus]|uniref:RecX family transcriptional regulator n=1 Tax=Caldalkalibacillus mannanilyticus TaxID=1418 RepID=UPI00046996F3|nr:RecX family transcriptional regulator [Caldalkalibacillus mannanilyticus]